jgi:hypothetical protein
MVRRAEVVVEPMLRMHRRMVGRPILVMSLRVPMVRVRRIGMVLDPMLRVHRRMMD